MVKLENLIPFPKDQSPNNEKNTFSVFSFITTRRLNIEFFTRYAQKLMVSREPVEPNDMVKKTTYAY